MEFKNGGSGVLYGWIGFSLIKGGGRISDSIVNDRLLGKGLRRVVV